MCGEHLLANGVESPLFGSSPRGPREHTFFSADTAAYAGSSPRVRGTHLDQTLSLNLGGIIPACAGNTTRGEREDCTTRDHPRLWGTRCAPSKPVHLTEDIPGVCGEHVPAWCHLRIMRQIIPACAGTQAQTSTADCTTGIIPAWPGTRALAEVAFTSRG